MSSQARHTLLASQIGVSPVHASASPAVHCTHSLLEQTGVAGGHADASASTHSTQAPVWVSHTALAPHSPAVHARHVLVALQIGVLPVHKAWLEAVHCTHHSPLQAGVCPEHMPLPVHAVHAGLPGSFAHAPMLQVCSTEPLHPWSPLRHTQVAAMPELLEHTGVGATHDTSAQLPMLHWRRPLPGVGATHSAGWVAGLHAWQAPATQMLLPVQSSAVELIGVQCPVESHV